MTGSDGFGGDSAWRASELSGQPDVAAVARTSADILANVQRVIVGKSEVIELLVVALLSEGHALIEDVPGMGKTVLARALARSLDASFARIQGTPDLLPADVTGVSYYNQKSGDFEFRQGPVFAHVVLADEINRATPRTQSALLEAMQEAQVTVEGQARALPHPFLLVATQNPIELEGTFPLPEAQVDRFLLRISMAYPSLDDERALLTRFRADRPLDALAPVLDMPRLARLIPVVRGVRVARVVADYLLALVRATREHPAVELGASPRASLALLHAAQASAAMRGRAFVQPDDVKRLAVPVLAHRLVTGGQSRLRGDDGVSIVQQIVARTPVPVEDGDGYDDR